MVDMWAGIDAGKREHHCVVIDGDGTQLLSQRVTNDEETLLGLIADVCELAQCPDAISNTFQGFRTC